MTVGTAQDFIANLEAKLGKGYSETIDGGVGPDYYDCSGLVMVCAAEAGVTIERTTWDQWDTLTRVEGEGLVGIEPGDPIYFSVTSDGGDPPQHVGVYLGPNRMIEAPHSGEVVMYSPIPNTPGEFPIGYCRIQFADAPPPPPPPPPVQEKENMLTYDPGNPGGSWALYSDGGIEGDGPSLFLGSLAGNRFGWQQVGTLAGICPWWDGTGWGYKVAIETASATGGEGGGAFDYYRFPSNGSLGVEGSVRFEETEEGRAYLGKPA